MSADLNLLEAGGIERYVALQADAVAAVTERFYSTHGSAYARFGQKGRAACREDLAFHLEFLRPVLEFGLLQPMVDYLCWLASVLAARRIPSEHLALSLDWLAEYFASQMDAAEAAIVSAALQAARDRFLATVALPLVTPLAPQAWPEAAAFEQALLAGKQADAWEVIKLGLDSGHSLVELEMHVIQPSLYAIGEKWQANQISVAQEHMATAIVQAVMSMGLMQAKLPPSLNKRALLACVEGNDHTVGLRMVTDALQLAGWEVQYLGANVPTGSIIQQAVEWKADLIGLSASFAQ